MEPATRTEETFRCVSQLNKKEEIELYIIRHPNGNITVKREVSPLSPGMLPRSYSLDHKIELLGSDYVINLNKETDYVFIPFSSSLEVTDFGNEAPDGGLVTISCVCCASTSGAAMGCAANNDKNGTFLNCYNGTGDCRTQDKTTECEPRVSSGEPITPTTAWGVIMKGRAANTTMH